MKRTIILVVSLFLLILPQIGFSQEEEPATEEVIVAETEHGSIPNYAIDDEGTERPGESLVRGLINTGVIPEDQEDELNAGRGFPVYSSQKTPASSTFSLGMPERPAPPQAPVKPTL
jgi:hypothetical protein